MNRDKYNQIWRSFEDFKNEMVNMATGFGVAKFKKSKKETVHAIGQKPIERKQNMSKADWIKTVNCRICDELGHLARDCPNKRQRTDRKKENNSNVTPNTSPNKRKRDETTDRATETPPKRRNRNCYICKKEGHIAKDCPEHDDNKNKTDLTYLNVFLVQEVTAQNSTVEKLATLA